MVDVRKVLCLCECTMDDKKSVMFLFYGGSLNFLMIQTIKLKMRGQASRKFLLIAERKSAILSVCEYLRIKGSVTQRNDFNLVFIHIDILFGIHCMWDKLDWHKSWLV